MRRPETVVGDVVVRPWRDGDEVGIVEGWNAIFPAQDGLAPRDLAYWRWQYREHPLGRTEVAVAEREGRIVGQYAAIPFRAVSEGEEVTIGGVCDAYVLPEHRRAGGRPGLIVHVVRMLHECWCGPDAALVRPGHVLLYGYPYPIWRVARRYLDSEMVRDMDVLFRELAAPGFRPVPLPGSCVVEEHAEVRALGDEPWRLVAGGTPFGLVRDGAFLDWRYARHPQREYRFVVARDAGDGRLRGLAVYRRGGYAAVTDAGLLCDWLCPAADDDAGTALLHGLERRGLADGAPVLVGVLPQNDPWFLALQRKGWLVGPPSHFLVMNSFGPEVRWLRDRWRFTLGDSDLV
ncbi:MAG: GNAT family N-acetyltransferase [Planctomycetota bacterium]